MKSLLILSVFILGCHNYDALSLSFDRDQGGDNDSDAAHNDASVSDGGVGDANLGDMPIVNADLVGADLTGATPDLLGIPSGDLAGCAVNFIRDQDELGVDCGGANCTPCAGTDWGEAKVQGLVYARDGGLYAMALVRKTIDRIDPITGRYSFYASLPSATPNQFVEMARSQMGTVLLRADQYFYEMIPETGALTLISSPTIGEGPLLQAASGSAPDSASLTQGSDGALYAGVLIGASSKLNIFRIELASGDRSIIASDTIGTGAPLPSFYETPRLSVDESGNVLVFGSGAIVSIAPSTLQRTALSAAGTTRWPVFTGGTPSYIAKRSDVANAYDVIFRFGPYAINEGQTTDASAMQIVLTTSTATFSNLSGAFNTRDNVMFQGNGTRFIYPYAIAGGPTGTTFVLDPSFPAVIQIDDVTGNRSVVAPTAIRRGAGPEMSEPMAVTVAADGQIYVAEFLAGAHQGNKAVFRIDPTTGDRTILSSNLDGTGVYYAIQDEIATGLVQQGTSLFMSLDVVGNSPRTVRIDLSSQARSETTTPPVMPALNTTVIGTDSYTISSAGNAVIRTGTSGTATIASNSIGSGLAFRNLQSIVANAAGHLLVVDQRNGVLLDIDPATGNRALVSGVGLP